MKPYYYGTSAFDQRISDLVRRRNQKGRPFQVFPGVVADADFVEIALELVFSLNQVFPDYDWSPCLTVPGHSSFPRGGIASATLWDPPKLLITNLELLGEIMARERKLGAVSIKKTSSTSVPYFTSNLLYKKAIVDFWLEHYHEILACKTFEERLQLAIAIVYAASVGYRTQADGFKELIIRDRRIVSYEHKIREVFDWQGKQVVSSKELTDPEFSGAPFMQACRSRQIAQESQTVNLPNVFYYKSIQRGMFTFGKALWKSGTGRDNVAKLESDKFPNLIKLDVKELDRHLHYDILEALRRGYIRGGLDPAFAQHLRMTIHGPMLCVEDYPNPTRHSWTYDPRKISEITLRDYDYGMPSGFAGVSPEDKAVFSMVMLTALQDCGLANHGERGIREFVENRSAYHRCINSGDDTVLAFNSKSNADAFISKITSYGMKIEQEEKLTYLGQDIVQHKDGRLECYPQLVNSLKNILVPEHSWGGPRRLNPGFGLIERNKYYDQNPAWHTVWHILNSTLRKFGKPGLDDYIADGSNPENRAPVTDDMLSLADSTFVMNPDAINYKILEDDVTASLLEKYYLTYGEDTAERFDNLFFGRT